jgi:hypothetical protein
MWEIIAEPQDYGIDALVEGMGNKNVSFEADERVKWAQEIGGFVDRIEGLADKSKALQELFQGAEPISATPASLKTMKVQLFKINEALNSALNLAGKIEDDIVRK